MIIISFSTLYIIFTSISASVTYRSDRTSILVSKEGPWGSWSPFIYCDPGEYAVGFFLKSEPIQSPGDDTSANGFGLVCMDKSYNYNPDWIFAGNNGRWGSWSQLKSCGLKAIKGFRTKVEDSCGTCDDTALNSIRAYCTSGDEIVAYSQGNWGTWGNIAQCPQGSVVCGFRQRVEATLLIGDDTALNAVQLACCQNSKTYTNGEGYWDPIYTGNSGVISDQTIRIGVTDYWQIIFTAENALSVETLLSTSMSFIYFENYGGEISLSLTSEQSATVTANSVEGLITTQTSRTTVSCDDEDNIEYYGLYQFVVSATEHGENQNSVTFDVNTRDYWCSTVPNQAPKCPAGYCNHSDNCQTCVGGFQNQSQRFSKLKIVTEPKLITQEPIKVITKKGFEFEKKELQI